ncbi:thiamine biosynthesis protein ThiS [Neorickettsia helminthoeca str. Oregon]|uniref:Thiamine biosynthesis protein ThiS n=1 Tax=Neorickettsia helminthoeca str. Oregon TaxID=1286528 RepID=X5H3B3_9RICK|nr:sulfur carrier protein ThiS [Neorickettsia helminthoeca]AHX11021.1 thiamine biosynthesis protein ThiS [Neorickettsia helminthoeca str. Oregon]
MIIKVNDKNLEVADSCTLFDLVIRLDLDTSQLAIEVNRAIIPKSMYKEHALKAGDSIEIVEFVGGG